MGRTWAGSAGRYTIAEYRRGEAAERVVASLNVIAQAQGRELFRELVAGDGSGGLPKLDPLVALVVRRERT